MPTYEYVCSKCDKSIEVFQKMTEDPLKTCPKDKCQQNTWGKGKIQRSISGGAGLIFKGSGFYITDYRSDSYKQGAKKEADSNSKSESKSESKSDSTSKSSDSKKASPTPPQKKEP